MPDHGGAAVRAMQAVKLIDRFRLWRREERGTAIERVHGVCKHQQRAERDLPRALKSWTCRGLVPLL
jgi:hypothetical protein